MKTTIKHLSIAIVLACTAGYASAGSATATLSGQVTVSGACTFSQGSYGDSVSATQGNKGQSSLSVGYQCSSGLTATMSALAPTASDGSGGTLQMYVYSDSSRNIAYRMDANPVALTADGNSNSITLYTEYVNFTNGLGINKVGTFNFSNTLTINYN